MSIDQTHGSGYCSDLLRARDEDRWLAAQYAPDALKRKLIALYAFHSELRRIPGAVSEPPLGEIRLQWWRDALEEIRAGKTPRAHPLVTEIAESALLEAVPPDALETAIDAAARPLYGEGFSGLSDLTGWLEKAESTIDVAAVQLAGEADAQRLESVRRAGAAFALARDGAGLAPSLSADGAAEAKACWAAARPGLRRIADKAAPAILHLSLTPLYLGRAARKAAPHKPFPLRKRLRLLSAMAFGRF
ncbi:MAG: squalene/phytoene synthase family protein [Hyphococcus sp.]